MASLSSLSHSSPETKSLLFRKFQDVADQRQNKSNLFQLIKDQFPDFKSTVRVRSIEGDIIKFNKVIFKYCFKTCEFQKTDSKRIYTSNSKLDNLRILKKYLTHPVEYNLSNYSKKELFGLLATSENLGFIDQINFSLYVKKYINLENSHKPRLIYPDQAYFPTEVESKSLPQRSQFDKVTPAFKDQLPISFMTFIDEGKLSLRLLPNFLKYFLCFIYYASSEKSREENPDIILQISDEEAFEIMEFIENLKTVFPTRKSELKELMNNGNGLNHSQINDYKKTFSGFSTHFQQKYQDCHSEEELYISYIEKADVSDTLELLFAFEIQNTAKTDLASGWSHFNKTNTLAHLKQKLLEGADAEKGSSLDSAKTSANAVSSNSSLSFSFSYLPKGMKDTQFPNCTSYEDILMKLFELSEETKDALAFAIYFDKSWNPAGRDEFLSAIYDQEEQNLRIFLFQSLECIAIEELDFVLKQNPALKALYDRLKNSKDLTDKDKFIV